MANKTLGTAAMTEQPVRFGFDPKTGFYTERNWKGHKDSVGQITPFLYVAGYKFDVSYGPGDLASITARIAAFDSSGGGGQPPPPGVDTQQVINTWELLGNKSTKEILQADCATVNALTNQGIEEIKYLIANPPNPPPGTAIYFADSNAELIYNLMHAGVEHWEVDQPILRHTYGVPANVNPGFAFANVRKILSTSTLVTGEGMPPGFLIPLGTIMSGFTSPTRTDGVSLIYGWKKEMPTLTVAYGGKQDVVAEYKFGLWSTVLYGTIV